MSIMSSTACSIVMAFLPTGSTDHSSLPPLPITPIYQICCSDPPRSPIVAFILTLFSRATARNSSQRRIAGAPKAFVIAVGVIVHHRLEACNGDGRHGVAVGCNLCLHLKRFWKIRVKRLCFVVYKGHCMRARHSVFYVPAAFTV